MSTILNIGSINIDHVYTVPHFILPGETLGVHSLSHFPGGKGLNQSVALSNAGGNVYHAGKVGPDGEEMLAVLRQAGVNVDHVTKDGSATGHTIIQVDPSGQNCILLYSGANFELEQKQIEAVFRFFEAGDILVLQNEVDHLEYMMDTAHQKGMKIAFNPSPIRDSLLSYPLEYVNWFLLNEIEGKALSGQENPADIIATMSQKYPRAAIVLTMGADGVLYRDAQTHCAHGIYKVPVVDTTAAGDTFTGFFISSVANGKTPAQALQLASAASALTVSRHGAAASIPTLAEVLEKAPTLVLA